MIRKGFEAAPIFSTRFLNRNTLDFAGMIDTRWAVAGSAAKLTDREDPLNVLSLDRRCSATSRGRQHRYGRDFSHRRPDRPIRRRAAGLEHPLPISPRRTVGRLFRPGPRYAELLLLPEPRWVFDYEGERLNGYWALASSLKTAIHAGRPILDAGYLSEIGSDELAEILAGRRRLGLMDQRAAGLREPGRLALHRHDGDLAAIVESAGGDAIRLVEIVRDCLPSYRDCVVYGGETVWLLKRAQILAADLYGALAGEGLGNLTRIDPLTTFADYKIPQILRHFGIMRYSQDLARMVDGRVPLPAGGSLEVEIRAATVWAVELLRAELLEHGIERSAVQLDWLLWEESQTINHQAPPYHRTLTIYY